MQSNFSSFCICFIWQCHHKTEIFWNTPLIQFPYTGFNKSCDVVFSSFCICLNSQKHHSKMKFFRVTVFIIFGLTSGTSSESRFQSCFDLCFSKAFHSICDYETQTLISCDKLYSRNMSDRVGFECLHNQIMAIDSSKFFVAIPNECKRKKLKPLQL